VEQGKYRAELAKQQKWLTSKYKEFRTMASNPLQSAQESIETTKTNNTTQSDPDVPHSVKESDKEVKVKPETSNADSVTEKVIKTEAPVTNETAIENSTTSGEITIENSNESGDVVSTYLEDKFDRRWLLLNAAQMQLECIPTPAATDNSKAFCKTMIVSLLTRLLVKH